MFDQALRDLIAAHYQHPDAELLLLSDLGTRISNVGLHPEPGDRRSLRETIEQIDNLTLVRDPQASAFIAVVLKGDEGRAEEAIVERQRLRFLRSLPRALLLAFTLDLAPEQKIAVQLGPKITYEAGTEVSAGFIEIEADLRMLGLDVQDVHELGADRALQLEGNIRAWCDRHNLNPASLPRPRHRGNRPPEASMAASPRSPHSSRPANALERLLDAQGPDVARALNVPIDIALVLSRMP